MGLLDLIGAGNDSHEFVGRVNDFISKEPELSLEACRFSRNPPERFAFSDVDNPTSFFVGDDLIGLYDRRSMLERKVGYAGSCRLVMSVRNKGKRVASIRSIIVNKAVLPSVSVGWSMLFTPEGGLAGEPWRFHCNLDDSPQRMRLCYPEHGEFIPGGAADYFEAGRIQVEPDHVADIVLVLEATRHAYDCSIQMRVESPKAGVYVIEPEDQPEIRIVPLKSIPAGKRYWYNFRPPPDCYSPEGTDYRVMF